MRIKVEFISEKFESPYKNKRGDQIENYVAVCLDRDDDKTTRLKNTVDYILTSEESKQYKGTLTDRRAEIGVSEFRVGFDGRLRCSGKILTIK